MEAPRPRARGASIVEAPERPAPRTPLRRLQVLVIVLAVTVPVGVYIAIVTDTIHLGPTQYDLLGNAMSVTVRVRWQSRSQNSTQLDFYTLLVTVQNNVTDNSIRPYELDASIPLPNATFWYSWPVSNFVAHQEQVTANDGELLLLPAGQVFAYADPMNVGQGTSRMRWLVLGDSSSGNVPVMDDHAQFYLENVALPKGSVLHANVTVTLTWDYHGSIQTYPVASRTMTVGFVMRSA